MSLVVDEINDEVRRLIPVSAELSETLRTAKTQTKRKYIKRKLKKVKDTIVDLLLALDKIDKKKKSNETNTLERRTS